VVETAISDARSSKPQVREKVFAWIADSGKQPFSLAVDFLASRVGTDSAHMWHWVYFRSLCLK